MKSDMTKVLVVDDEEHIVASLSAQLKQEGYDVSVATTGHQALQVARIERPSLILLDVTLPEIDGIEVCRQIRKWSTVPIILLSPKPDENEKVIGLEAGADDYFPKPFSTRELLARVKATLRRMQPAEAREQTLQAGDIVMDLDRRSVLVRGREIELTPKEFGLLRALMSHANRALGRDLLLSWVWGEHFVGATRTVDVHIRWLRKKIEENPHKPAHIQTVRGAGYRFRS